MRCPNCQTLNPPNAKFCLECGNRLIVCPNCGTVNLPTAKFCIECGTLLSALAERNGRPSNGNTSPSEYTSKIVDASQERANSFASSAPDSSFQRNKRPEVTVGRTTGQLIAPEERRIVTVMFADITGSTPLADKLDPEDLRAILAGYFNLMAEQIRRHGGTVEKYIGDAVMAVFGAPIAHEDDPDRAIRAALDMQAALNRFNTRRLERDPSATRLQMRIGINTGEVAAPSAGGDRQDFLITGDAVNVASRLQSAASPDTILVGERTYLATRNVFEFRPIAPLNLKGKGEPVPAWVVEGTRRRSPAITQHPRGIEGLQSPLVGRDLELTLMHATYARVQAERRPHLITLLGVPGIGKSRLVREFIQREEEAVRSAANDGRDVLPRVLQGRCPPYGEGITYWPLIEILRTLLQIGENEARDVLEQRLVDFVQATLTAAKRSEDALEISSALSRSIGGDLSVATGAAGVSERRDIQRSAHSKSSDQGGPQAELMRAWRVFLESIAEERPLMLIIDDMQWADEALLELLEYLTDRITQAPILFLCPARPDFLERRRDWGGGRRNFTTIVLEALSREESGELITGLLDNHDLPDVLYHTIQSRAEGNPFFVEEIVRMLIDQGVLIQEDGCWRVSDQNEAALSELASPATPPDDTLIDRHYVLQVPLLPDTVQGVLAARIDLLSATEKLVLQYAAIIGRTFWLSGILELAADLERGSVLRTIEALIAHEFITESEKPIRTPVPQDRVFSFKHILIRDVVYNNIPRLRRSQKHAQLALWLEEQVGDNVELYAELLAYHYRQALATWSSSVLTRSVENNEGEEDAFATEQLQLTRLELTRRSITYLTMAGDQAFHSYYTIRAIQAYSEALDLLYESKAASLTIALMHQKLGDAYAQRANADEAWHEYTHALKLIQEDEAEERKDNLLCLYMRMAELSTRWLGWFSVPPEMHEMRQYIDAGLQLLEGKGQAESGDRAAFLTYLAMWYIRQIRPASPDERPALADQALENIHEALRIAETVNSTGVLWVTLDALGFIYEQQNAYLEAHKVHHRRQELASRITGREELYDLYISLGWSHEQIAEYPAAARWFGRAWHIAQTMESPSMLLNSMLGRMYVWYEWNRWDEVREVAHSAIQMAEQYQLDDQWLLDSLETLADIAYRRGEQEESDSLVRQYRRLSEQRGFEPELSRSIYLAREDWARAYTDFKEALQRSEPFPRPSILSIAAELSVTVGESADIQQELCRRAVEHAERSGARKYSAIALRARGRMHLAQEHWDEAESDLKQALALCQSLDLPWEEGCTCYQLGQFYRQRAARLHDGDAEKREADLGFARRAFEQAIGFFESLKAVYDTERARQALANDPLSV